MARITVEDCIGKIPNRFELISIASERSRQLSNGAQALVSSDNDKNPVIALREIADTDLNIEKIRDQIIVKMQNSNLIENKDDEAVLDILNQDISQSISEENILFDTIEDGIPPSDGLNNEMRFEDVEDDILDQS